MYASFDFVRRIVPETSTSFQVFTAAVPSPTVLLHLDGANGSQDFIDSSVNAFTIIASNADPKLDTSQFVFGTASLKLINNGLIRVSNDTGGITVFGTGDFTIDCWVRWSDVTGPQGVWYNAFNAATVFIALSKDGATNKLIVESNVGGSLITSTTAVVINTWYHVAVTRASGNLRLFINGVQEGGTVTNNTNYVDGSPVFGANASNPMAGWIDEAREIVGTAAWTANFTPPTAPYAPP